MSHDRLNDDAIELLECHSLNKSKLMTNIKIK